MGQTLFLVKTVVIKFDVGELAINFLLNGPYDKAESSMPT